MLSALDPVQSQSSQSQPGGQVALSTLTEKENENQRVTFLRSLDCKWQVRNLAVRFMNFLLYLKKKGTSGRVAEERSDLRDRQT